MAQLNWLKMKRKKIKSKIIIKYFLVFMNSLEMMQNVYVRRTQKRISCFD